LIRCRNDTALEQAQIYTKDITVNYKNYLATLEKLLLLTFGTINAIVAGIELKQSAERYKLTIAVIAFVFIPILGIVVFYVQ
jgi:hypothetical protein